MKFFNQILTQDEKAGSPLPFLGAINLPVNQTLQTQTIRMQQMTEGSPQGIAPTAEIHHRLHAEACTSEGMTVKACPSMMKGVQIGLDVKQKRLVLKGFNWEESMVESEVALALTALCPRHPGEPVHHSHPCKFPQKSLTSLSLMKISLL